MTANDLILARMKSHNTLFCCGLDPSLKRLPAEILEKKISDEDKVMEFLEAAVKLTAAHACALKAQKALFDELPGGREVLRALISHVHRNYPGLQFLIDCKIGDTENTMASYIHNLFVLLEADGVVANPYMGDDVVTPLSELAEKAIVVLVKTSNKGGSIIQDLPLANGLPLWRHILDLVVNRWNSNGNMIPVLSSTAGLNMAALRPVIPDSMPILLAGIGDQGGSHADLRSLLNRQGIGVFANSSRGILYPPSPLPWRKAIEAAAVGLKEALNASRRAA